MALAKTHNLLTSAAGRRELKAARRDVLVQCSTCGATGSGRINGFGRIVHVTLAATTDRQKGLTHRGCGGSLEAFDTKVAP